VAESELFGHELGAFTDAASAHGPVEAAHGGTLFLDECRAVPGDSKPSATAIEDHKIRRVGANKAIPGTWR